MSAIEEQQIDYSDLKENCLSQWDVNLEILRVLKQIEINTRK